MNPSALIASSIDGLMIGFVYGLAAMGLTLIFGVMRVINLAHGPIIAMGMFAVLLLSQTLGLNPYLGLLVVLVLGLASESSSTSSPSTGSSTRRNSRPCWPPSRST